MLKTRSPKPEHPLGLRFRLAVLGELGAWGFGALGAQFGLGFRVILCVLVRKVGKCG